MMVSLARLEIFCEIARQGTLTAAAKKLGYTTSAVSQQLSSLEREVGATLLERMPRGVRLTESGHALLAHAERMLAEQRAAIAAIERISSAHRQRVRLGCVPDAGATLLPQTMVRFRRAFPSVELTVYEEARDTLVELLQAGELELAVLHEVADVEDLDVYPLYFDALRVVLPAGHRLTRPCEVTMTHLAEETWILTADQEDDLAVLCEGTGVRPAATLRVGTPQTAQAMAVAGLGIALGSSLLAPRDDVITRSVHGDTLVRRVYVAARRDVEWSRAMLGVHRMLERAASENGLPPVPGAVPLSPRRRASGRMAS